MTRQELKKRFGLSNGQCTRFRSFGVLADASDIELATYVGKAKQATRDNLAKIKSVNNGARRSWWNGFSTRPWMQGRGLRGTP